MLELLAIAKTISAAWYALAILSVYTLVNFSRQKKLLVQQQQKHEQEVQMLQGEMRALLDSSATMGEKLKQMERRARLLEERQDQLTLKEPSQQTYANAIRMVRHGADIETVVEQSGLSRGEVELLQLLNRMEDGTRPAVRAAS